MDKAEFKSLVPGIVADHYRENVAQLMDCPIVNRMALEVPSHYDLENMPGFSMAALTEYKNRCEKAGKPNNAHSIGSVGWAIIALRKRWAKIASVSGVPPKKNIYLSKEIDKD